MLPPIAMAPMRIVPEGRINKQETPVSNSNKHFAKCNVLALARTKTHRLKPELRDLSHGAGFDVGIPVPIDSSHNCSTHLKLCVKVLQDRIKFPLEFGRDYVE
jgi:hypothetical protein